MKIILDDTEKKILNKLQHGAELCNFPGVHGLRWSSNHEAVDEIALGNLVNIGFIKEVPITASSLVPSGSYSAIGTTLYQYEYIPKNYRTIK